MSGFRPVIPGGGGGGDFEPNTVYIDDDYQALATDDYIVSDGSGHTITLPLFANATKAVSISNEGASIDTIDGNGKAVPNSTDLSPTEVRIFFPGVSEWIEQ